MLPLSSLTRPSLFAAKSRILVTGARASATVDIVRWLDSLGHHVEVADTLRWPVAAVSRAARAYWRHPSPRFAPHEYTQWLRARSHEFDHLFPSSEEVFASARTGLTQVFAPSFATLLRVHDKAELARWLPTTPLPLHCPRTEEVTLGSRQAHFVPEGWVAKPAFSRSGFRTVFGPGWVVNDETVSRWVLQEYSCGEEVSSYSIAIEGDRQVHVLYDDPDRKQGETCLRFRRRQIAELDEFCAAFCRYTQWNGQIAFDFRRHRDGSWKVLEANPRLTSGIHLVRRPHLEEVQIRSAVALRRPWRLGTRSFWNTPDALPEEGDQRPAFRSLLCHFELQARFGWPVAKANTHDLAYP